MKSLEIKGGTGRSEIRVGDSLDSLTDLTGGRRLIIVTDTKVNDLYGDRFPEGERIVIGMGEGIKTLDTVREIYDRLVNLEADRSMLLVGIGGGIVCDITGFVASTYLRGVGFGFVATTLLAQVDASVGGKNGVNFRGYKNMVGVFRQPEFVICDMEVLNTLSPDDLHCGFAEIVKHGAIADPALFVLLEERCEDALTLDAGLMTEVVHRSVAIKADVVSRDETEKGERRKLNFGHTFGHAIEKVSGVPHGAAVSAGMVIAARLSHRRGYLAAEDAARLERLLARLGLPVRLPVDGAKAVDALRKDKKREGDHIHFVLLRQLGEAVIESISISELEEVIHDLCSN